VAFLDSEQQEVAPPEQPERPRRLEPERRRQQFLLRRLIAVGVGFAFLILLVLGVRGCLEARSDRGLRNYSEDIGTIMQESEQRGDEFFELLDNPGSASEQQFEQQVSSQRNYAQSLLDRAEHIGVPGAMDDAQSAAELTLKLRRDALQVISENVGGATADRETGDAIAAITDQMQSLYASDVIWTREASPEITDVLDGEGVDGQDLPAGNFMPEGSEAIEFLDQTTIVEKLAGVTGAESTAGAQGLGLVDVTIGDVNLDPEVTNEVSSDSNEVTIDIQNQGEADESGVQVSVTVNDGSPVNKTIEEIAAGDTTEVTIPVTDLPQPGTEAQLEVVVQPVEGEAVTDNNTATYTVIFGSPEAE
jgi:hypothetical protein